MNTYGPTSKPVAGYKLNLGMVCVNHCVAAHFKPQPLGVFVGRYLIRPFADMPAGAQ